MGELQRDQSDRGHVVSKLKAKPCLDAKVAKCHRQTSLESVFCERKDEKLDELATAAEENRLAEVNLRVGLIGCSRKTDVTTTVCKFINVFKAQNWN